MTALDEALVTSCACEAEGGGVVANETAQQVLLRCAAQRGVEV